MLRSHPRPQYGPDSIPAGRKVVAAGRGSGGGGSGKGGEAAVGRWRERRKEDRVAGRWEGRILAGEGWQGVVGG